MKRLVRSICGLLCLVFNLTFLSLPAYPADDMQSLKARMEALEKELAEMRALLAKQEQKAVSATDIEQLRDEVKVVRANQAEWKSYDSKVHLTGYAAASYATETANGNDGFNEVMFAPIFHCGYKDLILLESELEIAVEPEGEAEFELEYLTVDWFVNDYITLLAGKFLSPLGQFQQNLHPSWINKLPSLPVGFGHGGATPLAEVGAELRGGFEFPMFAERSLVNYAFYVGNGPELVLAGAGHEEGEEEEAEEEEEGEEEEMEMGELEEIETGGFTADVDDEKVFGGRIGILPIPNIELGFSGAFGDVALEDDPERDYAALGVDFFGRWRNLDVRAEWIKQDVDSEAGSIAPGGLEWEAWYVQGSYKLLPTRFELVARYSEFDSTREEQEREQWAIGLNYLFSNQAMAKLAYEFNDAFAGLPADEDRLLLQLSYGF